MKLNLVKIPKDRFEDKTCFLVDEQIRMEVYEKVEILIYDEVWDEICDKLWVDVCDKIHLMNT